MKAIVLIIVCLINLKISPQQTKNSSINHCLADVVIEKMPLVSLTERIVAIFKSKSLYTSKSIEPHKSCFTFMIILTPFFLLK